jgi:hypothetical protein
MLSPSTMKVGIENGIGCYPGRFSQEEEAKDRTSALGQLLT